MATSEHLSSGQTHGRNLAVPESRPVSLCCGLQLIALFGRQITQVLLNVLTRCVGEWRDQFRKGPHESAVELR